VNVATLRREVEKLEAERRDQLVPVAERPVDFARSVGVSLVLAQDRDRFAREPAYLYLLRREFEEQGTKILALNDRGR
jgi:hypothetical protein